MSKRELQSEVQHQRLEAQVTDLIARNAELTAKNEDLTAEVKTLTADRDRQAGSLKKNLASINELTAKVTELESNIAGMQKDYANVCKELEGHGLSLLSSDDGLQVVVMEDVHERSTAQAATITRLRDTIALLEAQLADGTDADDAHLQTIANLSEDVGIDKSKLDFLNWQIEEFQQDLVAAILAKQSVPQWNALKVGPLAAKQETLWDTLDDLTAERDALLRDALLALMCGLSSR